MKQKFKKWQSETAQSIRDVTRLDPIEGAIKLASDVTLEFDIRHPGTQLELLASSQDAQIQEIEMHDAGRLIIVNEPQFNYLIQVNIADSRSRKNFSICHEIGHTLMPNFTGTVSPPPDKELMQWDQNKEEEFLCDIAAAELLMPRREFIPRLRGCGLYIQTLQELAEEFSASLEAIAVNIVRANVSDVAVIVWEPGWNEAQRKDMGNPVLPFDDELECIKPPEKAFRIKFASGCGEMEKFFFPTNISTEPDSLITKAASTEFPVCGMQELRLGQDIRRQFYTQSQSYKVRHSDAYERKVITLVHLQPPE